MSQPTIDSEVDKYDPFLIATLQAMQKEGSTHRPTHYVFDMNELVELIAQEANKARLQTALNFATRLKLEFTKRELSSDKMPDGYRKMTNEELITKVWGELTAEKGSNNG